jgi:hypothetical protein
MQGAPSNTGMGGKNTTRRFKEALSIYIFHKRRWQLTTAGLLLADPPTGRIITTCNQRVRTRNFTTPLKGKGKVVPVLN